MAFVVTDAGFDVAIKGKASRQLSAWVLLFCLLRLLPMGVEDVVCVGSHPPVMRGAGFRVVVDGKSE